MNAKIADPISGKLRAHKANFLQNLFFAILVLSVISGKGP